MNRRMSDRGRKYSTRHGRKPTPRRALRRRLALGLKWMLLSGLAAAACGLAVLWLWAHQSVVGPGRSGTWQLRTDSGSLSWAEQLATSGWVDSSWKLSLYAKLRRPGWQPPRQAHLITGPVSPEGLLALLARTAARASRKLVVPEGYNRFQIAKRLQEQGICGAQAFLTVSAERRYLVALGVHASTAEGYLFPATYQLYRNSPPDKVLATLVKETFRRLAATGVELSLRGPSQGLGWGIHELLTLASMIEKESAKDSERPLIAGVFFNRLQSKSFRPLHMLQSDPTAAYGCLLQPDLASCRKFNGQVSAQMLRDTGNRYNTYRHAGLPPGPIGNPGVASVAAVLKPKNSDFLFFVAGKGRGHQFSRTLAEHRKATHRR